MKKLANELSDGPTDKVKLFDAIFNDLVFDASELIRDLYTGVKMYLFFGMVMLLFGVSELASNIEQLQERLYIPAFVAASMFFAGVVYVYQYFRLRKKYSRLFKAEIEMKNS